MRTMGCPPGAAGVMGLVTTLVAMSVWTVRVSGQESAPRAAPRTEAPARFAVELRVQGKESVLEQARSSFAKELEALPGVEVVDSLGDWRLLVLAADMRNDATTLGIVVGATLLAVVDGDDLSTADPRVGSELHDFLERRPLRVYKNMWVYYGGPNDMRAIARQVASEVDASVFEPCRSVAGSRHAGSYPGAAPCHRAGRSRRAVRSTVLDAPVSDEAERTAPVG